MWVIETSTTIPLLKELIPYGWGHSDAGETNNLKEAIVFEETAELARSRGGAGASRETYSSCSKISFLIRGVRK